MQTKIRVRFYIQRFIADVCQNRHFRLVNVCFCSVSTTAFVSGSMWEAWKEGGMTQLFSLCWKLKFTDHKMSHAGCQSHTRWFKKLLRPRAFSIWLFSASLGCSDSFTCILLWFRWLSNEVDQLSLEVKLLQVQHEIMLIFFSLPSLFLFAAHLCQLELGEGSYVEILWREP